jgi:hypothetical protein
VVGHLDRSRFRTEQEVQKALQAYEPPAVQMQSPGDELEQKLELRLAQRLAQLEGRLSKLEPKPRASTT